MGLRVPVQLGTPRPMCPGRQERQRSWHTNRKELPMSISLTTTPGPTLAPPTRPVTATATGVLLVALGTVTALGGAVFSTLAGGWWYAAVGPFVVAFVLWWVAGLGVLRGSSRARRLAVALLVALFGFGLIKIFVYHESASYLFQSLTLLVGAMVMSAQVRRWASR